MESRKNSIQKFNNIIYSRKNITTNLTSLHFLFFYTFFKNLEFFLFKKQVFLTYYTYNIYKTKINILLNIFIFTSKLIKIKANLQKKVQSQNIKRGGITKNTKIIKKNFLSLTNKKSSKNVLKKDKFLFFIKYLLNKKFNAITLKKFNINIFVLNSSKFLKSKILKKQQKKIFDFLRSEVPGLFLRRFNLLIDFSKICVLFLKKKISTHFFLKILINIFQSLHKKKHQSYFYIVTKLFDYFLIKFNINNNLKGLKLRINGKLLGKSRSSSFCLVRGEIPLKSFSVLTSYSQLTAFTKYGTFGFSLWISYNK